jgi:hypothetical protein
MCRNIKTLASSEPPATDDEIRASALQFIRKMNVFDCPFCRPLPKNRIVSESDMFIAFLDGFPVSNGHTLVIPQRHVSSVFDLSQSEFLWDSGHRSQRYAIFWRTDSIQQDLCELAVKFTF